MTPDIETRFTLFPSIGVDALSLDRYSHIDTEDGELIIFDEKRESSWIQCDFWIPVETME